MCISGSRPKPSRKIESVNKAFLFWFCLGIKLFFFQDRKLKLLEAVWKRISWNLTKFQLNQTTDRKNENNNCLNKLNELKFCEVSRNSISNRFWKFQLSILKNKKVLFLKKYFLSHIAKIDPKDGVSCPNFQWRFRSRPIKPKPQWRQIIKDYFLFIIYKVSW